ncbi:putative E ORF D [Vaccinia virus Copenhagen]|uniref:Uncharacterized 7.6 kDa protein n=2 Tax=Orthopoxvirus TaxID=10242 RepID=YVED_VACCC|nr:RecName: Full=Uncharacterized 7.6 kDa protein [Vaccinia virus Copenhagen]AAA48048.1 putative E ORF D [Vaccinia virus Copenhagen]WDR17194.1 putative E ORF D [Vaccinia virus Copenhagen]WDR17405.1 putative E ORF D [Vaccinia virus Copenhagen]CRL86533.1 hypothetical protein pCPXV0206 [Cowpox virus]
MEVNNKKLINSFVGRAENFRRYDTYLPENDPLAMNSVFTFSSYTGIGPLYRDMRNSNFLSNPNEMG